MAKRRWTEEEDATIRREAATKTYAAIGAMIDRTYEAVQNRALTLGIARFRRAEPWSAEELETLRRLYPAMRTDRIAEQMGRSRHSITTNARQMGLRKDFAQVRIGRRGGARVSNARAHAGRSDLMGRPRGVRLFESDRAWSATDDAARHLRRLAPVHRCDAAGDFDATGAFWRFGAKVLDGAALEERAERAGWVRP